MRLYLDSSAIVKLVQREDETAALRRFLRRHRDDGWMTSALARVEVVRAVLLAGPNAIAQARRQLARLDHVAMTPSLLDQAATLEPSGQRGLDAIRLAAALLVRDQLRAVVTYDRRMANAAADLGLAVATPA